MISTKTVLFFRQNDRNHVASISRRGTSIHFQSIFRRSIVHYQFVMIADTAQIFAGEAYAKGILQNADSLRIIRKISRGGNAMRLIKISVVSLFFDFLIDPHFPLPADRR